MIDVGDVLRIELELEASREQLRRASHRDVDGKFLVDGDHVLGRQQRHRRGFGLRLAGSGGRPIEPGAETEP